MSILAQLADQNAFFNVREEAVTTASGIVIPGKKALINETTGAAMSVVSTRYRTVANQEVFESFDKALASANDIDTTDATVDVKFSHGGARTMVNIVLPKHEIDINGDVSKLQITALNSYDGAWRYVTKAGAVRMACMNGQVLGSFAAGYSSTHTASLDVERSSASIIEQLQAFQSAKEYWGNMMETKVNRVEVRQVIADFFGIDTHAEGFEKRPQVIDMMRRYDTYKRIMGATLYAIYNALTEYVTHREYKSGTEAHSRMYHTNRLEKVLDTNSLFRTESTPRNYG